MNRLAVFKLSHKTTKQEIIGSYPLGDKQINELFNSVNFQEVVRETAATAMVYDDQVDGVDYIGAENWKVIDYHEVHLPKWSEAVFVPKALNQSIQANTILRKTAHTYLAAMIHQATYLIWKSSEELADVPYPVAVKFEIRSWEDTPDVGYSFVDMTFYAQGMKPINFDRIAENHVQLVLDFGELEEHEDSSMGELGNQTSELSQNILDGIRDKVDAEDIYNNWETLMDDEHFFRFSEEFFSKIEAGE